MKAIFSAILMIVTLASCSTVTLLEKSDLKKIPRGSTKVIAKKSVSADSLLTILTHQMAKDGWTVTTNKEARQISTTMRSVQGGTSMKVNAYVEPVTGGSMVTFSGEWGLDLDGSIAVNSYNSFGANGSKTIIWTGELSKKTNLAFQNLIIIAIDIKPSSLFYEK